jgi:hypothetical protein
MKKITNLLIVCSLALAGAVMAQEPTPDEGKSPSKKGPEKKAPAEVKPKTAQPPKSEAPAVKEPAAKEPGAAESPATTKPEKPEKPEKKGPSNKKNGPATAPETKTSADLPSSSATPAKTKPQSQQHSKDMKAPAASTTATATPATTPAAATKPATTPAAATTASTTPAATTASATPAAGATTTPATSTATTTPAAMTAPSASASVAQTSPANSVNPAAAKKPDPQKVQQIQQQHASFRAQPRPDRVPAVSFSANFRLPGSERWQGPQYEVYRSYHPERHDQGWYRQHYQRVELIGGGYYYFNNGYWYPAWGYSPREEYYAYDAPIYVGKHAEPPDKVIANVQAVLQDMGYYRGEVDGLLGPLTREALTGYQRDHGMTVTAVIDEPTLASLDMG